jgi:predicted dehydrogenase
MTSPLPQDAPAIRWGILAPGGICKAFANAVNAHTQSTIVATGSRSLERAQAFADEFDAGTAYGSYEELVADPNVDAVYVASPHTYHRDHALLAIEAGKHVLLEKPFALNVSQAREIVDAARAKGVFCMEAMWTRHLPHVLELREVIARGDIGEVVSIQADHGQQLTHIERLMNPELAGGSLLDLGVYPISFTHDLLGVPDSITSVGQLTDSGVDGQVSVILNYGSRAQATLHTTLWAQTPTTAVIAGTEGRIEVEGDFYRPSSFTVKRKDGTSWSFDGDFPNGYAFEAAETANRITAGDTESPRMTLDSTLEVMATLDEVRAQIGLAYPGE